MPLLLTLTVTTLSPATHSLLQVHFPARSSRLPLASKAKVSAFAASAAQFSWPSPGVVAALNVSLVLRTGAASSR